MKEDKKTWLRKAEIFSTLSDIELEYIENISVFKNFSEGEEILTEGETKKVLYIIASGKVQIVKTDKWEGSTLIAELVEGDIIGELEFFAGTPFTATTVAVSDTTVLSIGDEGESFDKMLGTHPEVTAAILYQFLRFFSKRLRKANVLVRDNSALVRELKRQVYGDKLTGLYNKTYLEETLPEITNSDTPTVSLMLMKPDNFKMINDTFGHEAGDNTLKIMAASLNNFMKDKGTVLRYMGNELGVILENHDKKMALEEAEKILQMFNTLDISSATGSKDVFLSMSIGIAVYPDHANIPEELILQAHELPLVGRSRGGNMILFPADNEEAESK